MNVKQRLAALRSKAKPAKKSAPKPATKHTPQTTSRRTSGNGALIAKNFVEKQPPKGEILPRPKRISEIVDIKVTLTKIPETIEATIPTPAPKRIATEAEMQRANNIIGYIPPQPIERVLRKPTLAEAIIMVNQRGIAYAHLFMDNMGISYEQAVKMMDTLEREGVIAKAEGLTFFNHSYRRVLMQSAGGKR